MDKDLFKKLDALPAEDPDGLDLAMLAQADRENDGSTVTLSEAKSRL